MYVELRCNNCGNGEKSWTYYQAKEGDFTGKFCQCGGALLVDKIITE